MKTEILAFAAYHPSVAAVSILCVCVLLQAVLTAPLALANGKEEPGRPLKGTYADFSFRVMRTHGNSVENLPVFVVAVGLAIAAGVAPFWVNVLASLHVAFRTLYWGLYYSGAGAAAGGPRSLAFVGAWLSNTVLAVWGLGALIFS